MEEQRLVQIIADLTESADDLGRLSRVIKADLVRLSELVYLITALAKVKVPATTGDADND